MESRMNKQELINVIESLGIDYDEFWILSTSALVIRGEYPDAGDLDIAVTRKGLEQLKQRFDIVQKSNGWYMVNDKVECVLDTKEDWKIEKYGKYNLESIKKYYQYLMASNREKDKVKLEIVEKYINDNDIII